MKNKVIVKILVPEIDESYDVYLPINKKIGNIIELLNKSINELSNGNFPLSSNNVLFNVDTKKTYQSDVLLLNTDIRNGTRLIILSR
jgi:beta-galactosidase beta subunit